MKRKLAACFLAMNLALPVVFANAVGAPVIADHGSATNVAKEIGIDQKLNGQLPLEAVFKNEKGETVRLGDYFGSKPVLINLVYFRCPMLCGFVLDGIVKVLRPTTFTPGKEFEIVTVSIDPKDTPAEASEKKAKTLKDYKRPGAEKGWHFLTGDKSSIDALADSLGFRYVYDSKSGQYAHAGGIMVATVQGKISRYFYGIEYAPRDLRFALVEASANKIGSFADQILLLCFHYDPMTGKYGFVIWNVLRLAGFFTLSLILIGVFFMLRAERAGKL